MLRLSISTCTRRMVAVSPRVQVCRSYAKKHPSPFKRALTQEQLQGTPEPVSANLSAVPESVTASKTVITEAATTVAKPTTLSPNGGVGGGDPSSGGGEFMLPLAVVATAMGAGWYYYSIVEPRSRNNQELSPIVETTPEVIEEAKQTTIESDIAIHEPQTISEAKTESISIIPHEVSEGEPDKETSLNESIEISAESNDETTSALNTLPTSQSKDEITTSEAIAVTDIEEPKGKEILQEEKLTSGKEAQLIDASVQAAIEELRPSTESLAARRHAYESVRASMDESLYSDLDNLTPSELKIRIVQLGTELIERTKWEAVRWKEYERLHEREWNERLLEQMQKQRIELEDSLARKLREQEDELIRKTNAALQQKDAGIEAVIAATKNSLELEHEANLSSQKELLDAELSANYEIKYRNDLTAAKQQYLNDLESKLSTIQDLSKKLEEMEKVLNVSRSFTDGSVKAHRLSAAALSVAQKLETSLGAQPEVAALQSVASDNSVIASALSAVPSSVATGIPTLSELQTKFSRVYDKSRQAALVPAGNLTLEGQLFGTVLKSLKFPPSPDDPAPEENQNDSEYVLVRAKRHVQLGELDRAVAELEKLNGQVAFTVQDWKKSAQDRIEIDKALHIIKMEVALMNETLSKAVE